MAGKHTNGADAVHAIIAAAGEHWPLPDDE